MAVELCDAVVGVYLYGQVLPGIDEFYEQREAVAEAFEAPLAHKLGSEKLRKLSEGEAAVFSESHDCLASGYRRDFPTFANMMQTSLCMAKRDNLLASPESLLEQRFECKYVHIIGLLFRY
jgi:hypothetical protein